MLRGSSGELGNVDGTTASGDGGVEDVLMEEQELFLSVDKRILNHVLWWW